MSIYPRGNTFMVSVGSGKDRQRVACKTHEEAEAKERELLAARAAAALIAQHGGEKTLQDAYDRAFRDVWKGSKGERTTTLNARQMLELLGASTPLPLVSSDAIAEALDELDDLGNTGATINKKLATINVMLKTAHAHQWIKTVPFSKRRKEASQRIYWYTEEEETAMIDACKHLGLHDIADFIPFAIDTGFRRSELLKLAPSDYYRGAVQLYRGQTKNDDGRTVPATAIVKSTCERAAERKQARVFEGLTEAVLRSQWAHLREYLGKSEDPKYIVHVLRHTTATRLAIKGATGPEIMAYMGHKSIQTSMRYIHLTHAHLGRVAGLLTRSKPAPVFRLIQGGGAIHRAV